MQQTLGITIVEKFDIPRTWLRDLVLVLVGSSLIALSAQVVVRLPFSLVPVTGQTFAVLLVGFLFGRRLSVITTTAYILEGILGLPVFAGGGAGIGWLLGPTGGYLLGFVVASWLVGYLADQGRDRSFFSILSVFLLGQMVIYLFGVSWLAVYTELVPAIQTGMLPFLVGDLAKALLAAGVLLGGWKVVDLEK